MRVRVLFFAAARERVGCDATEVELEAGSRVAELWSRLCSDFPGLEGFDGSIAFAVNLAYVDRNQTLHDNDEVACIPPVSGG